MRFWSLAFMLVFLLTSQGWAQQTGFNYSGRVKLTGVPFNGKGQFKFAIVSQDGQVTYWTNDGVTQTSDEPTSPVEIDVNDGYFSLKIGDTDLPGMETLDASVFNNHERLYLRIWFNDGQHGFEELNPRTEIVNPELIGLQNSKNTTIYVNAITGNDRYSGTKPNRAKKTLQAAWDIVPKFVQQDVNIQLAAGTYYGTTLLKGKAVIGDAAINIIGDISSPASVVLSGAQDSITSSTGFHTDILLVDAQRNLILKGFQFQRAKINAIEMKNRSEIRLEKSIFLNNSVGISCVSSDLVLVDSKIGDYAPNGWGAGVYATEQSKASFYGCEVYNQNPASEGIACWSLSTVYLQGTLVRDCNIGIHTQYNGFLTFAGGGNVLKNCAIGIQSRMNSTIFGSTSTYGMLQYQNCTVDRQVSTGVQIDQ